MKAIVRRLLPLEDRFGSSGETEYDLWLRQRLEAAKRRIAEARKRGELPLAEEERPLTEFEQRRLEILKQAAWHARRSAESALEHLDRAQAPGRVNRYRYYRLTGV